ncbi:NAD(P)H dehydrogenase [Nostoc sp. 3335mG]|nr:NAD(P)H dehydrogenase [Nostoc sp. 3335mG]
MPEAPRRLLHIEASPRGERSRSSAVARRLIDRLGTVKVERLNLFDADLPAFDGAAIEGRYALIAGEPVAPGIAADWAAIRAHVDHLLSFDTWLISTPMWNFGLPYRLKHYIDLVTHPGMTFAIEPTGIIGLAAGRTAIVVGSGALDTRPGSAMADHDHQIAYLRRWLAFVGIEDVHVVTICPTYGTAEDVEAVTDEAYAAAEAVAAELAGHA